MSLDEHAPMIEMESGHHFRSPVDGRVHCRCGLGRLEVLAATPSPDPGLPLVAERLAKAAYNNGLQMPSSSWWGRVVVEYARLASEAKEEARP